MTDKNKIDISQAATPGLARRLAAMLYDSLLVFGLLLLASMIITLPVGLLLGESASSALSANPLFRIWLAAVPPLFFLLFWIKGGQTLGMRSWRLRVIRADGAPLQWPDALKRLCYSLLSWLPMGLGYLWIIFDRNNLAWHDHLSGTRLVMLSKKTSN
ncbi:MAG: RDD family protein [Sedimenticola sp.]|nr:RDD family protein [Sedimenticola sp.]